jgi:hypothetical protein
MPPEDAGSAAACLMSCRSLPGRLPSAPARARPFGAAPAGHDRPRRWRHDAGSGHGRRAVCADRCRAWRTMPLDAALWRLYDNSLAAVCPSPALRWPWAQRAVAWPGAAPEVSLPAARPASSASRRGFWPAASWRIPGPGRPGEPRLGLREAGSESLVARKPGRAQGGGTRGYIRWMADAIWIPGPPSLGGCGRACDRGCRCDRPDRPVRRRRFRRWRLLAQRWWGAVC